MLMFPRSMRPPRREAGAAHVLSDLFALLLVVVVIVGAATSEALVAALGALALVVTVVARLWARLSLEEVTYKRELSEQRVIAGDELVLTITVENRKSLPVPWLKVRDFIPAGLDAPDADASCRHAIGGSELVTTTSLGRYERVRLRHRLRAPTRGYYRLGPAKLESGDLFGLYQSRREDAPGSVGLVVCPRPVPLPGFYLPSARPIGDARTHVRLWTDPDRPNGIREYRPGDPARSVDWKASARLQELHVRTYDPSVSQYAVVLLDATTTEHPWDGYSPDVLEAAVSAAASVAVRAAELGYRVGLVTNGVPPSEDARMVIPPGAGHGQAPAILEALAMVRPLTVRTIEEVVEREAAGAIPFGSTVIYISGVFKAPTLDSLAGLRARGHPVQLLWVGEGPPPSPAGLRVLDGRATFGSPMPDDAFRRPSDVVPDVDWTEGAAIA